MEREGLFHPRIINDREWTEGYYRGNRKNIERIGRRYAQIIGRTGFGEGRILDAGCGYRI